MAATSACGTPARSEAAGRTSSASPRSPPRLNVSALSVAAAMSLPMQDWILREASGSTVPTDRFWRDPTLLMSEAGMPPDPWQARLLRQPAAQTLLLCSRQAGKSQTAAAVALQVAMLEEDSLVLLLSPTLRQSGELFKDKLLRLYHSLKRPVPAAQETALTLTLTNGSRVISLPGNEEGIRGYSGVSLLIVDEASRVPDALYYSVRPMLAVSGGRLAAMSTPFGKRGWFYEEWEGGSGWKRVRVTAAQCPRISPEFLAGERKALGDRWFRQEYGCSFEDVIDAVFAEEDIQAALTHSVTPLF
jgi:hypothetical protein